MTYYHKSKEEALGAAAHLKPDWSVRAALEPYNGWVAILTPRRLDVLQGYDLNELLDSFELDLGLHRRRPPEFRKAPAVVKKAKPPKRPPAPPKKPPAPPKKPPHKPPAAPPPPPRSNA